MEAFQGNSSIDPSMEQMWETKKLSRRNDIPFEILRMSVS